VARHDEAHRLHLCDNDVAGVAFSAGGDGEKGPPELPTTTHRSSRDKAAKVAPPRLVATAEEDRLNISWSM